MRLLPVMQRELTSQSRQSSTYWLRVVAAVGMLGAFTSAVSTGASGPGARLGARLFDVLNLTTYYLILFCVPLLTADCISREKREGTLGLLFLTPLRAADIVLGKAATQGLRGLTLLLAMVPMLLLPSLLGGVGATKVLLSLAIQAALFLMALTAGIVVSSLSQRPIRSALGAIGLAVLMALPLNLVLGAFFGTGLWAPLFLPETWILGGWNPGPQFVLGGTPSARVAAAVAARRMAGLTITGTAGLKWEYWLMMIGLVVLVVTAAGLWQATRQVALFWQEADHSSAKLRRTVETWARTLAFAALGTQVMLLVGVLVANRGAGGLLRLPAESPMFLKLLFFAPLAVLVPVFGVNALASRRAPAAGEAAAEGGWVEGPVGAGRRNWRFLGGWTVASGCLAFLPPVLIMPAATWSVALTKLAGGLTFFLLNTLAIAGVALAAAALAAGWRRHWSTALAWGLVLAVLLEAAFVAGTGGLAIARCDALLASTNSRLNTDLNRASTFPMLGLALVTWSDPELLVTERVYEDVPVELIASLRAIVLEDGAALALAAFGLAILGQRLARRRLVPGRHVTVLDEQRALTRDFCEPLVGRTWFRRRSRRLLEVNPIRWLHQRSWSARLTSWGWCLAVVVAEIPVVMDINRLANVLEHQVWLLIALQAGLAFAAAGSFQREKETGALELILVTPLSAAQVVRGRWLAIVLQFLPSFSVIVFLAVAAGRLWSVNYFPWDQLTPIAEALFPVLSAPLVGLYWSLRFRSTVAAWLLTCCCSLAVAAIARGAGVLLIRVPIPGAGGLVLRHLDSPAFLAFAIVSLGAHVLVGRWFWRSLLAGIRNRRLVLP